MEYNERSREWARFVIGYLLAHQASLLLSISYGVFHSAMDRAVVIHLVSLKSIGTFLAKSLLSLLLSVSQNNVGGKELSKVSREVSHSRQIPLGVVAQVLL